MQTGILISPEQLAAAKSTDPLVIIDTRDPESYAAVPMFKNPMEVQAEMRTAGTTPESNIYLCQGTDPRRIRRRHQERDRFLDGHRARTGPQGRPGARGAVGEIPSL